MPFSNLYFGSCARRACPRATLDNLAQRRCHGARELGFLALGYSRHPSFLRSVGVHGFLGPSIAPKRRRLRLCSAHDNGFSNGTRSRMVCFSIGPWRSNGRHRGRSAFSATPHPLVHSGNHQRPGEDSHGHPKLHRSKNPFQVPGPALRKYSSHMVPIRSLSTGLRAPAVPG